MAHTQNAANTQRNINRHEERPEHAVAQGPEAQHAIDESLDDAHNAARITSESAAEHAALATHVEKTREEKNIVEKMWEKPGGKLMVVGLGVMVLALGVKVFNSLSKKAGENKEGGLLNMLGLGGALSVLTGGSVGLTETFGEAIVKNIKEKLNIEGDIDAALALIKSGEITEGIDMLRKDIAVPKETAQHASALGVDASALFLLEKTGVEMDDFVEGAGGIGTVLSGISGFLGIDAKKTTDPKEENIRSLLKDFAPESYGLPATLEAYDALLLLAAEKRNDGSAEKVRMELVEKYDTAIARLQETAAESMPKTNATLEEMKRHFGEGNIPAALSAMAALPSVFASEGVRGAVNVTGEGAMEVVVFAGTDAAPWFATTGIPYYFSFVKERTKEVMEYIVGEEAGFFTASAATVMAVGSTMGVVRSGITHNPLRPIRYAKALLKGGVGGLTGMPIVSSAVAAINAPDAIKAMKLRMMLAAETLEPIQGVKHLKRRSPEWYGRRVVILEELEQITRRYDQRVANEVFEALEEAERDLKGAMKLKGLDPEKAHDFAKEAMAKKRARRFEVKKAFTTKEVEAKANKVVTNLKKAEGFEKGLLRKKLQLELPQPPDMRAISPEKRAMALGSYATEIRSKETRANAIIAAAVKKLEDSKNALSSKEYKAQMKRLDAEIIQPLARAKKEAIVALDSAYKSVPPKERTSALKEACKAAIYNPDGTFTSKVIKGVKGRAKVMAFSAALMVGAEMLTGPEKDLYDTLSDFGPDMVQLLMDVLPFVGTYNAFYAAITGETTFSEKDESDMVGRGLNTLFGVIGGAADIATLATLGAATPANMAARVGILGAKMGMRAEKIKRITNAMPLFATMSERMGGWSPFAKSFMKVIEQVKASKNAASIRAEKVLGGSKNMLAASLRVAPTAAITATMAYSAMDSIALHEDLQK